MNRYILTPAESRHSCSSYPPGLLCYAPPPEGYAPRMNIFTCKIVSISKSSVDTNTKKYR